MDDRLSQEALELLRDGVCPFCHRQDLRPGPRGGLSENWSCGRCGARFNKLGPRCEMGVQLLPGPKAMGRA